MKSLLVTTVIHDGACRFSVRDDTFREAGRIGVWSKADSTTQLEPPHHGDNR